LSHATPGVDLVVTNPPYGVQKKGELAEALIRHALAQSSSNSPDKTEAHCKKIVEVWTGTGLIYTKKYESPKKGEEIDGSGQTPAPTLWKVRARSVQPGRVRLTGQPKPAMLRVISQAPQRAPPSRRCCLVSAQSSPAESDP